MTKTIYSTADLTTDTYVALVHNPTPWTTWDVTRSKLTAAFPSKTIQFDSLIDAAAEVVALMGTFSDGDRPSRGDAIDAIVAHFNDDKIYRGDDESYPFLINEYEWDDEEED